MGLSGIVTGEHEKYTAELPKGRTIKYEGEKYHTSSNGNKTAWFDIRGAWVGSCLDAVLTSLYKNSRQKNSKNKPPKVKEFLAA